VQTVCIASPFYKCDIDGHKLSEGQGPLHGAAGVDFSEQIRILDASIVAAHRLGARYIRVFDFWNNKTLDRDLEERVAEAFVLPAKKAQENGVILLLENEHACLSGTGAATASILRVINHPNVRAIWDPGNAYMAGETPFPDGYEALKPFIEHVHVKDAAEGPEGRVWTIVGDGACAWGDQLRALKRDGYDGFVSLETHYNGLATKEESSRRCLERLLQIVKEVN